MVGQQRRMLAPEDRQREGSQTPPQPSPLLRRVVVDTTASSSHLFLTPKHKLCHHVCQDRESKG